MNNFIFPLFVNRDIQVVVASFGGVGTTFLMNYISQYKKTNFSCDRDQIKHSSLPPISFNKNIKFVYVYGDPILATISLFRRGYHSWQSEKLTRYESNLVSPISPESSLEEYVDLQKDLFNFRSHFYNWYEKYLVHPTMFIRYESIFENIGSLIDFLELPEVAVANIPVKKERKSLQQNISDETTDKLLGIYGEFSEELKNLKDVEIRVPSDQKSLLKTYCSYPYPQAVFKNLFDIKLMTRSNIPKTYKELQNIKNSWKSVPR